MTQLPVKKWPWWKVVLAYLALAGLAAASIALVDRKVHDPPVESMSPESVNVK
jgi:hypothetical protein